MKYLLCLLALIFVACSSTPPQKAGNTEAEVVYKEAEDLVKQGRFLLASEKLNLIRSKYPYSYFATHAELLQADILYKQENYIEAAAAYILFKDFHPKHLKMDYVLFQIAESFRSQMPDTFDRDLSPGYEAINYYNELKKMFGSSELAKDASQKIDTIKKMFEQKEQYVADFYFKTKRYDAALFRYKKIVKNFSSKPLLDHAMLRIVEASYLLSLKNECLNFYQNFKTSISDKYSHDLARAKSRCEGIKETEL